MVLECLCPWSGNLSMISWTKIPDKDPVAVFHPEFGVAFSRHYRERIEFLRTTPMDGSIAMRNVTHQDIGLYHCSVQTFPQGPWTRNIQVEDLDEPPRDDEDIVEPSTPEVMGVDTELVAEHNSNVTIGCNRQHNATIYQVILEKMPHNQPWSIIGVCKRVEGGLVGEDYSDRGRVNCTDSLELSLHLQGVVQEDSGFYRCTLSTDAGVQTTTMLLTVPPPGGFSLSVYMMYIYIGSGAAGLILLTAIIILALKHSRKKNKRVEYRVKQHLSQRQPNLYENVLCPRKKQRQIKKCPVYANLQTVRSHRATRQLHVK